MKYFYSFLFILTSTAALHAGKINVVTVAIGERYQQLVHAGIENKITYCQQHDYDLFCFMESLDTSRHPAWSKIPAIMQTFEDPACEWVVWLDADTLIMNLDVPLEDFIDPQYNLIFGKDDNGLNSGVFFIKNCEWSRQFLTQVYSRTEFLNHIWWEQAAILDEMKKPQYYLPTKVFPQRLFNSYPVNWPLNSGYQKGDFIIHFASHHGEALSGFFNAFSDRVVNDRNLITLDLYLGYYGFSLSPNDSLNNEGYMSQEQTGQLNGLLATHPEIQSILEIGLNGGHSAENFFQNCKNLKEFTSFDICRHPYTPVAVEYLARKYKSKFEFIKGDSATTIPQYAAQFPEAHFDLIYIDGSHEYNACQSDILNCRQFANQDTLLLIDDYHAWIKDAVEALVQQGYVEITNVHHSYDLIAGFRAWAEGRYL